MSDPTHQKPAPGGLSSRKIPRAPGGAVPPAADGPQAEPALHTLNEADGQALDALLAVRAGGSDRGPTPPGLGERTEKLTELLGLLDRDAVEDPPADLTARTLEALRAREQRKRFTEQVQMLSQPRRSLGVDWRQVVSAAAVFVIATSLLMPVMERQQADSRRVAGAGNLSRAGQAFARYAADNEGQLPRGNIRAGEVWWEVGRPQAVNSQFARSNSAHFFRLYSQGYVTNIEDLSCPENAHARAHPISPGDLDWASPRAVSFSYQNQYTPNLLRLEDDPTMPVLADRNPRFPVQGDRIVFSPDTPLFAPSRAHRGAGQNVLTADGHVAWRFRPTLDPLGVDSPDSFWGATGIDYYTGTEVASQPGDSFLVP